MILRELEIGDIFYAESDKRPKPEKYVVRNNCMFSLGHGSAVRNCVKLPCGPVVSKSANLNVIKAGESKHKAKLQKLYGVTKNIAAKII
jgi:hypothetical protein